MMIHPTPGHDLAVQAAGVGLPRTLPKAKLDHPLPSLGDPSIIRDHRGMEIYGVDDKYGQEDG